MSDAADATREPLPAVLMWLRTDVPGWEVVVVDDRSGLRARGSQHAVDPVPYALSYELWTDARWATTRLVAHAEGAGWTRDLELTRNGNEWTSVSAAAGEADIASFDGSGVRAPAPPGIADPEALRGAVDVDIGGSPLTNALPVRRLGLLATEPGSVVRLGSAWVLPPTLEVVASAQTYEVLSGDRIRYGDAGNGAVIEYDADGWVRDYEGLARRVAG
ncbi:putative glycolipid-binding domain-containing protein [Planctomonas deserti]|uniref:putative glycolipid-binding domain-containing protein n=1 Tax=Planctomonas deserti TaxID=2144185 RepID=UPI00197C07A3|nr:putative glycolipid-binding domain-containing protein [Planctomonas deserti]